MAPAPSTLQHDAAHHRSLPNFETPKVKRISNAAVSSPGYVQVRTDAKRKNTLHALCERVPQLPVDFFLGPKGILPPLHPDLDIPTVVAKLKATKDLVINSDGGRWATYARDPSQYDEHEDVVFKYIAEITAAVQNASGIGSSSTLEFKCNPSLSPSSSTRTNDTKPDCYGLLKGARTNVVNGNPYWVDIAVPGEFKKNTANSNWEQTLWSLNYIMQEDAERRFVFAFSIEDTKMRVWFASRSEVLVSFPFDFITDYRRTITFFLRLMYASEVQLGWDSTMKRLSPRHELGNVQYDILCDGVWYRTVRLISDVGAGALRGRGTRVWEVNETTTDDHGDVIVDPTPRVLKDSWVDASREREAVIMQKIREDASKCQDPLVLGLNFDKYFMKIKASWDVTIAGAVDDTHALIRCGRYFEGMAREPLMICSPTKKRRAKYDSNGPLGPTGAIKLPDTYVERVLEYDAKIHHRVVFTEVGVTVTEIGTLSGALRALADATRALFILHRSGWVHRDISTGNILVVNGGGRLSDLEYAKKQGDPGHRGVRTGTPFFMATEVERNTYLHGATPSSRKNRAQVSGGSNAERLQWLAPWDEDPDSDATDGFGQPKGPKPRPRDREEEALEFARITGEAFHHNPLHDFESMFWVGAWILACSDFVREGKAPSAMSDEDWKVCVRRHAAFGQTLFGAENMRYEVFVSARSFLQGAKGLLGPVYGVVYDLDVFRTELLNEYTAASIRHRDSSQEISFSSMVGVDLYISLIALFDGNALDLRKGDNDLTINVSTRDEKRLQMQEASKQESEPAASDDEEDGGPNAKRRKTGGAGSATSGPSRGTRSLASRNRSGGQ
ncbi:hypothetical protein PHLGIDRAFT_494333 [Phlebiopsis gigantea 11061_1 CR5-6]|uniref:Fungal-type protein kinase domain-containing protein n=1 Tax=Phlebiopsis gigantea (strain 11061_1 CR5-6) TaxID=745531 RepID=A0A0C3S6H0_PHLG1|nr:hypothetical protein PHLGIDRAFT_494333 [Phlebiopsis gigantea 11061_1 CR5-6]